jgi:hypothetical protein
VSRRPKRASPSSTLLDVVGRGERTLAQASAILPNMTNQAHVSAAADDVRPVAGEYYTGLVNHHHLGTCEVYLTKAPESVIDRLRAMHPGVIPEHSRSRVIALYRSS